MPALAPPLYLPADTPILLTLQAPPHLTHHPPLVLETPFVPTPLDSSIATEAAPRFRLLDPNQALSRSRHISSTDVRSLHRLPRVHSLTSPPRSREQADTSDAHYHRLHRFPEVLEKRSTRLERERLIHERSKLILEIEEMRGRGWVYHGAQGGKGEEVRRRKLQEGEERLKRFVLSPSCPRTQLIKRRRYDALLPNQPRKSNFLNMGSTTVAPASASTSRASSPAILSRRDSSNRHGTPTSVSGDGGTTIRIKFANGTSSKGRPRTTYASYDDGDEEDDDDDDEAGGRRSTAKRDRKAERARAAERILLGLPPRASLDKAARGGGKRRRVVNVEMGRDSQAESDEELSSDEEGVRPLHSKKVITSFFESEALRASVMDVSTSNRRSSARVLWAFGRRIPEAALLRQGEFELYGGSDSSKGPTLEDLVRQRMGAKDPSLFVHGINVPPSALAAWAKGPPPATAHEEPPPPATAHDLPPPPPPTTTTVPPGPQPGSNVVILHTHGTRRAKLPVLALSNKGRMEVTTRIDE